MLSRFIKLCLLFFSPAAVLAQNLSTPGALELYPTIHAIGVRLTYTGDDNTNATALIEWRKSGETSWHQGMAMSRLITSASRRWAGSVLFAAPAASYEVRATINDPDGSGAPVSGTVTTRTNVIPSPSPSAATIWVATDGNDANPGTQALPLKTISIAMSRANPGDQVRLKPGIYYQEVNSGVALRSGSASNYIHLISDVPRAAVLDGSDPANQFRNDWLDEGGGVFSIPYSGTPRVISVGSGSSLYRLNAHQTLSNLQTGTIPSVGGSPVLPVPPVNQGWVIANGRLYIRLEGNLSPIGKQINIARYDIGIFMDANYWHIEGLAFQHFGFSSTSTGSSGIRLYGALGTVIHNVYTSTIGGRGIYVSKGSNDSFISDSTFYDSRVGSWPWDASKSLMQESVSGVAVRTGRGHVISNNTVQGTFDGLDCGDGAVDSDIATDLDYTENDISACADDGMELEVTSGINVRALGNRIHNCFDGISIAPVYNGPMYILYNTLYDLWRRAFKPSLSGVANIWIMHNTTWSGRSPFSALWPTGPYSNLHFRNNILSGTNQGGVDDDSGESQSGNDFDGDQLFSSGSSTVFRWRNTDYSSISALRSATGFEANGASGDPLFTNQAGFNFSLRAGSPAIDAALRFPGINDNFQGAGPDRGAGEYHSSSGDTTAPAAPLNLHVN